MSLLIIGTVAFDDVETPFGKSGRMVGGSASYIGLCCSYFLNKVNLITIENSLGEDLVKQKYPHIAHKVMYVPVGVNDVFLKDQHTVLSNQDILDVIVKHEPKCYLKPNTRFNYSNTNYALLGMPERCDNK